MLLHLLRAEAEPINPKSFGKYKVMRGGLKDPRKMQQGGGPNQATTVGVVMGLINKLLPTDENVKADSESRVVYAFNNASSALLTEADLDATAEGAQVSFTANLAQLELYLKMKLINFGLPDYAGRLFSRHGNAGVMYFVNTVDPLVNDAMSSSPSTLTDRNSVV